MPKRVSLYDRLPEIHRIRDAQQIPPFPLRAYLEGVEEAFGAVHESIETLYHDQSIEHCAPWVIPYIADLLGVSHLAGDPTTLRADVANTIARRRRKGTLAALEQAVADLTGWGVHAVELFRRLVWAQHLNHQRADRVPAADVAHHDRGSQERRPWAATLSIRDPKRLALLGTAFDDSARHPDLRPPAPHQRRANLPNVAVFVWRLQDHTVPAARPHRLTPLEPPASEGHAPFVVRVEAHPTGHPLVLFNAQRPGRTPPPLTAVDEAPAPMERARLRVPHIEHYVRVDDYVPGRPETIEQHDVGLVIHVPATDVDARRMSVRGENLCAWLQGLAQPLEAGHIAMDPSIGRLAIGVGSESERDALLDHLRLSVTYGAPGAVGAHPSPRPDWPSQFAGHDVDRTEIRRISGGDRELEIALSGLSTETAGPLLIEITDSETYELDPGRVTGAVDEGGWTWPLGRSVFIRATAGQRPIVRLDEPLRLRPTRTADDDPAVHARIRAMVASLTFRLEGLYVTAAASFPSGRALVERAAVHALDLRHSTLDPGGYAERRGTTAPSIRALSLDNRFGYASDTDAAAFGQRPELHVFRSIVGAIGAGDHHRLLATDSIIDAGAAPAMAIASPVDASTDWGPEMHVFGVTVLGRVRVASLDGQGAIFRDRAEVRRHQTGCIKYSYVSGDGDRLPQRFACASGQDARLRFVDTRFEAPGYVQLHHGSAFAIRERGPRDDEMGAYGFVRNAHKLRNLNVRFRELVPVGTRPLLIPLT